MKVIAFTGNPLTNPGVKPLVTSFNVNYWGIFNKLGYLGFVKLSLYILLFTLSIIKIVAKAALPPAPPQSIIHVLLGLYSYFFKYS